MSDYTKTSYPTVCSILAEIWMDYRSDPEFQDFIEYNDLGLPLAYAVSSQIVVSNNVSQEIIQETWGLFLEALGLDDNGWESLEQIFIAVE